MRTPDLRAAITVSQAMERVGVSRRTIYNWMDRGWVEYVRTASGSRRIIEESLWQPAHARTMRDYRAREVK